MWQNFKENYQKADKLLIARGLAAVAVVFSHVFQFAYHDLDRWDKSVFQPVSLIWFDGLAAVVVFFVLSGYLMGKVFFTGKYRFNFRSLLDFYWHRARRILPLYYFMAMFSAIFVFPEILKPERRNVLLHVLTFTYDNRTDRMLYNLVIWSLAVEVQFYLLLPLLAWLMMRLTKTRWQVVGLWITLLAISVVKHYLEYTTGGRLAQFLTVGIWQALDIFLIGMLVYPTLKVFPGLRAWFAKRSWLAVAPLILVLVGSAVNNFYHVFPNYRDGPGLYAVIIALLSALCIYLAEAKDLEKKPQSNGTTVMGFVTNPLAWLEWLGTLSYGIYLWHYVVFTAIIRIYPIYGLPLIQVMAYTGGGLLVTLVLSLVTYLGVEQPAQKWRLFLWSKAD